MFSFLSFADDSFLGGSRTCEDDTSTFTIWSLPLYLRGRFDGARCLFVQCSSPHINAYLADYNSDGCLGSKHDSANRRHQRRFDFPNVFMPSLLTLSHSVEFSDSIRLQRPIFMLYCFLLHW